MANKKTNAPPKNQKERRKNVKMKSINVFLNKEERKQIDLIKNKYQLSLTTIANILAYETLHLFMQIGKKEQLTKEYIYKNEKNTKTSIKKPKNSELTINMVDGKSPSRIYTNAIKLYLKKEINKYCNDAKLKQDYYNKINKKFTTTKDEFYNYNQFIRTQRRYLRENKEYLKNEIAKIENK